MFKFGTSEQASGEDEGKEDAAAFSTELVVVRGGAAAGQDHQKISLTETNDEPSNTTNITAAVRPMTCGEVWASTCHILTSNEAVGQTEVVGPDGEEKKVGLLGRLNARRSKLTLMHPIMVALVFSIAGLYDAGTDVWLAATFEETMLAEFDPSNDKCVQYFDPLWSEFSCSDRTANSNCTK